MKYVAIGIHLRRGTAASILNCVILGFRGPGLSLSDPETFAKTSKDAVIIFKKPTRDGVHIEDVKQINNEWVVTGTSGVVLIVVGTGTTMKAAQKQAYNRIDNIIIPNMYYRKDIGDRWFEDFDRLHTWGYLRP